MWALWFDEWFAKALVMRVRGQKCDPFFALFLFHYTRRNFSWEQEIEFPIFLHWYKVCRIIRRTSHRPHSIPMTFRVEFGFLMAQFNSPYLLHSSSYDFSRRTWDFHSPIFCAITVPMISLVELAASQNQIFQALRNPLMSAYKSWVWWVVAPPCLLRCVLGSPPWRSSSIFADVAVVYDETASASHRCGYLENTVSSSSALAALQADSMCLPNTI